MAQEPLGINSTCVHTGEAEDKQHKGAVSPIFVSSSYAYENVDVKRYPRYFNTPNQEGISKKIAALEHKEAGMIFGSGMAAISTAVLAFLKHGDHVIFQNALYGGTVNFIHKEFTRFGIEYSFTNGLNKEDFERELRPNTKMVYVETPSNPLLKITDLKMVGEFAKKNQLISLIDNTFASPIIQVPDDFGIDVVIHSATKYMGGHSDIAAGAVAASKENIDKIWSIAINFGGSLSDYTVWLLERSMKTMALRVNAQCDNAMAMALYLDEHPLVEKVYYPGLESHPEHELAKEQMTKFGAIVSFELKEQLNSSEFFSALKLIKPSLSLAGVESTMLSPSKTSHSLLSAEQRKEAGIEDKLIRFSLGIEEVSDLIEDIEQALKQIQ